MLLAARVYVSYLCFEKIGEVIVKTFYQISSSATGTVVLRKRKIAKALRWWLRENGIVFNYTFFTVINYCALKNKSKVMDSGTVESNSDVIRGQNLRNIFQGKIATRESSYTGSSANLLQKYAKTCSIILTVWAL